MVGNSRFSHPFPTRSSATTFCRPGLPTLTHLSLLQIVWYSADLVALQHTHKVDIFEPDRQLCFFMLPEPDAHLTQEGSTSGTTEGNTTSESLCTWGLHSFS